jgi:hypothetical protein
MNRRLPGSDSEQRLFWQTVLEKSWMSCYHSSLFSLLSNEFISNLWAMGKRTMDMSTRIRSPIRNGHHEQIQNTKFSLIVSVEENLGIAGWSKLQSNKLPDNEVIITLAVFDPSINKRGHQETNDGEPKTGFDVTSARRRCCPFPNAVTFTMDHRFSHISRLDRHPRNFLKSPEEL